MAVVSWDEEVIEAVAARLLGDPRIPTGTTASVITMPDRDLCYAVNVYPASEGDHGHSEVVQVVQVRAKGVPDDARPTLLLAQIARDAFHLQEDFMLGPARIARAWRQSHGTIGVDSVGRVETSSNFYMLTGRHTPGVTD